MRYLKDIGDRFFREWDEKRKNERLKRAAAAGLLRLAIDTAKKIHWQAIFKSGEC
jgi:hypothetical protein